MNLLQGVLEASPDAVLVVDERGVIRRANQKVAEILGYSPDELHGKVVEELLLEEDRENHVQFRQKYMEDPEPRPMGRELDLYALHRDGTQVPVEISLGPIRQNGDLYIVTSITDITRRKKRERKLQRQNDRLDDFASIVSHDLRNPLRTAEGSLELLREECDSEHIERIDRALTRIDDLIEDLLTLARTGDQVAEFEAIDLEELVENCWLTVETAEATVSTNTDRTIYADQSRLKQLFENLIRNAIEHGGADVAVTVGDLDGGFYLEDDGPGIPEDARGDVFEAGYSTSETGTGFGLNIVKQTVEAHGWDIRVRGSVDGGARFEITGVGFVE